MSQTDQFNSNSGYAGGNNVSTANMSEAWQSQFKDAGTVKGFRENLQNASGTTGLRQLYGGLFGKGGGGDPHQASNLRATIAREEWADYKKRFQPIENQLLGYVKNSDQFIKGEQDKALGSVNDQFSRAPDQIARREASYGLQMTPEMQQNTQQRLQQSQSLSQVQALNTSGRLAKDQLLGIEGGGMFTGTKQLIGGLGSVPSTKGG
jgi:hypothetical protein